MRKLLLAVVALSLFINQAAAHDYQRKALTGLRGVVPKVYFAAEQDQELRQLFSESTLQTAIELHLRKAGLYVGVPEQTRAGAPVMLIGVATMRTEGAFVYSVSVDLIENGQIDRLPTTSIKAIVWNTDLLGTTTSEILDNKVTDAIRGALDQFINDWRAANPKK